MMKALIKIMVVVLCLSNGVELIAQQRMRPAPPVEKRVKRAKSELNKQLTLNENQNTAINKAYTEFYISLDQLHAEMNPVKRPPKEKMKALTKERDNQIKAVMNKDEFDRYREVAKAINRPPDRQSAPQEVGLSTGANR